MRRSKQKIYNRSFISLNKKRDPEEMRLLNRFASLRKIAPTTLAKELIREVLPQKIAQIKTQCQQNSEVAHA